MSAVVLQPGALEPSAPRPASALPAPADLPPPPSPGRRLEIPPYDLEASLALQAELGISHVLAQVLARRGLVDPELARGYLEPREDHDPAGFAGIDQAVGLIREHIAAGARIVVHGDYDVDGVCATALVVQALGSLGADVGWFLPSRAEDGYGLSRATVQRLCDRGARLLITVDCGVTAVEEVAAAKDAGLDVVVTDHHSPRPDGRLPDCPLLHPRLCGYPCPDLCGTAVAFKLARALDAPGEERDLELVALATVADLVPLQGENRRLVRSGLAALANTTRPGLRALMSVASVDPSDVDAAALGFRLAPRINASGRLRRADAGLELLLTDDRERADEVAAELDTLNGERRAVEQRILWEAQQQVAMLGERSAYVLAGEDWHPGVIGIVASRIVERYHRPAIMVATGDEGVGQGSGRSIPGFDLLAALRAADSHLLRYGGHSAAAGLTVAVEEVASVRQAIEDHAMQALTPELLQPVEQIDAVVCGSELGLDLAEELALLEPCGMGNPRPRLLIPGARFDEVRTMGEGRHVRFSVSSGGARARAVAFGCEGKVPGGERRPLDASFRLERNVYHGAVEPRLVLGHADPCSPAAIELLDREEPYLELVWRELERELSPSNGASPASAEAGRTVVDRRGRSPLTVLADARACATPVLAICAEVSRRLSGLAERTGGFTLISYAALAARPKLAQSFPQLVALDPPASEEEAALLRRGEGVLQLAWGEAELRFALQMHALEYDLRPSLRDLYRRLRQHGTAGGEDLVRLLGGDGSHARSPRLAGRLIRVLSELGLVTVDRARSTVTLGNQARTELERSAAYRAYARRHEDGKRFLSSAKLQPSG